MGLKIDIPTPFGIPAAYWNIGEEHKDYRDLSNRIVLYGYASEYARREGSTPISAIQVLAKGADFNPEATRANSYVYVKTTAPEFLDAIDA